jgi:nitroimidazol reductase NimA-like FMN-containing flavoprotein (pyridoxamine 5'-phosphate oxidase superfamily)
MKKTKRSTIKRVPKRALYDQKTIYELLDRNHLCHVGFIYEDFPAVIPTLYGRKENTIFLHGAAVSRLMTSLKKEIPLCISIAKTTGIVLARSAFHHSLNYESIVLHGSGRLVEGFEKEHALKAISDHLIVGRWEECRPPTTKELKATHVISVDLEEVSAKVRTGGPLDDKQDYSSDYWAGVIPIIEKFGIPQPDQQLPDRLKKIPTSIQNLTNN